MQYYYGSVMVMTMMALGTLCVLVGENERIEAKDKRVYYLTCVMIAASAIAEWLGVRLNGNELYPVWLLRLVKCVDYSLTPMAGWMLVAQLRTSRLRTRILLGILAGNLLLQVVSMFTGWMVTVDAGHHYNHGPLYFVYILIYAAVILLLVNEFLIFGRDYRDHNRASLFCIMGLVVAGILMQELLSGQVRTAYLALTFGAAFLFIHFSEFRQMTMDDQILEQQIQIDIDALTGALSRHAYSQTIDTFNKRGSLPQDLVALSIDINGLKTVNDSMGHDAGDKLICGASACIREVLGPDGKCYRTGGDEFVLLVNMEKEQVVQLLRDLETSAKEWTAAMGYRLSFSTGYACASEYGDISVDQLIRESDQQMYRAKARFYMGQGSRRQRRRASMYSRA